MTPATEKRALQATMAVTLLLPLAAALPGIAGGPGFLGRPAVIPVDLDSHFRYLSGLFLGMLLLFASCVPAVETKGARMRMLALMVVIGGLARAGSWIAVGQPSAGHVAGLVVELGLVPLLVIWQARVARRMGR